MVWIMIDWVIDNNDWYKTVLHIKETVIKKQLTIFRPYLSQNFPHRMEPTIHPLNTTLSV